MSGHRWLIAFLACLLPSALPAVGKTTEAAATNSAVVETARSARDAQHALKEAEQDGGADLRIILPDPACASSNPPAACQAQVLKGAPDPRFRGNAPCLSWVDPDVPPRAALLCVHGLGLYNGMYEDFGKEMARRGIATYAIDVRGFGSWMKAQGREQVNFNGCIYDVAHTLKALRKANKGLPVFLLGESMGGAIALQVAAENPGLVDGLISSVPSADRFQQGKTAVKVAIHLIGSPNKPFDVGTGVIKQATQDPGLRQSWENDPQARLKLSAKELLQFQHFMNQNHDCAKMITAVPVLIVQGCKDRLVKPEGTVELFNELPTPDRELVLIPDSEHLIFEENQFSKKVLDLVADWLNNHISRLPVASSPPVSGQTTTP